MLYRFETLAAQVVLRRASAVVLGIVMPILALAQTVSYPPPGSAPGAPQNPTVPTTVTQTVTQSGNCGPNGGGSTTTTSQTTENVLLPFTVQGATYNGLAGLSWPAFVLPASLQESNALVVVNGVSQASGSSFSPATITTPFTIGTTTGSDAETYSASVSGVTLNEQWTGPYNDSSNGGTLTQNFTYTFTSSYNIVSGDQSFSWQWTGTQVSQATLYVGGPCVGTTNVNEQGSTTINWLGNPITAPTIAPSLPAGKAGVLYPPAVLISGGTLPYSNISAPGLPPGLSVNQNGSVSGTPAAADAGQYTATVSVTDAAGSKAGPTPVSIMITAKPPLMCDASAGITPQLQGVAPPGAATTWQNDVYDDSAYSIGNKGCALTSLSMALGAVGVTMDPGLLNQLLTAGKGYNEGINKAGKASANVNWPKAINIVRDNVPGTPPSLSFNTLGGFKSGAAASQALNNAICGDVLPVVVGVNLDPTTGDPGHYVLVTGETYSGDYQILDPYYGHTLLSQFPGGFQTRGEVKDPVDVSFLEVAGGTNVDIEVINQSHIATGFDPVASLVRQDIPNSAYFQDRTDTINADGSTTVDPTVFRSVAIQTPVAGTYLVVVHGNSSGPYAITVDGASQNGIGKATVQLSGSVEAGSLFTYRIAFSPVDNINTTSASIVGDVNGDGVVDWKDLEIVIASFDKRVGQKGFDPRADVNVDGIVNLKDLDIVLRAFLEARERDIH